MNAKPTPDEPNPLRKLFHPKWLRAFKQAVRTRGEQGWSQMFDSLRLCPGCGEELMVRRNGTLYFPATGLGGLHPDEVQPTLAILPDNVVVWAR